MASLGSGNIDIIQSVAPAAGLARGNGIRLHAVLLLAGILGLINTSPEPFSNWTASFGEELLLLGGLWAAARHPLAFLAGLAAFLLMALYLLPKICRGMRLVWRTLVATLPR